MSTPVLLNFKRVGEQHLNARLVKHFIALSQQVK